MYTIKRQSKFGVLFPARQIAWSSLSSISITNITKDIAFPTRLTKTKQKEFYFEFSFVLPLLVIYSLMIILMSMLMSHTSQQFLVLSLF